MQEPYNPRRKNTKTGGSSVDDALEHPLNMCKYSEVQLLEEENLRLKNELDFIYKSKSWRVTLPIRLALNNLRVFRQKLKLLISGGVEYIRGSLYKVSRSNMIPARIKYYFIALLSRLSLRAVNRYNNASNNQVLQQLASARASMIQRKVFLQDEFIDRKIDLSVVTYNSEKWIDTFFKSLIEQRFPVSQIHLHFVDNGSRDRTVEVLNTWINKHANDFASINLYCEENNGFGAGHDFAIRRSFEELILVSNIDLEFEQTSILDAVRVALADDGNTASWEFRQKPYEHPKYIDPVTLETSWSSHACVLLRRSAYEDVGGYEKKIFMYGEDVELSFRFRRAGYRVCYCPHSVVWHNTYEFAGQVKKLQFSGSTLANAYIRLRYGTIGEIFQIPILYFAQLVIGSPLREGRRLLLKNLGKVCMNAPYFLLSRKKSDTKFPFRAWDYEMQREGPFYSLSNMPVNCPRVSIITRTYKGRENWLRECCVSVFNQTYPNIEWIVVEDGGDTMEKEVEKFKSLAPRNITIVYSPQPKNGRSYNGNAGLKLSTGKYLSFLDDDDLIFPDHVEVLASELISDPSVSGVYSLSWEVETSPLDSSADTESHYVEKTHRTPAIFRQEFSKEVLRHHNYLPIQSVLFKRELFEKHGGFDVSMDALEDWDLWVKYTVDSNFRYIEKTTSLFRTPHCLEERARRHAVLHESYEQALAKQKEYVKKTMACQASASISNVEAS